MTRKSCYIPNGRVIVFNFPAGAGGKMLQNCVGLSRSCVLTNLEYAQWQMNYGEIDDQFYAQKLAWILSTLPPKDQMQFWLGYEISEMSLYKQNYVGFNAEQPIPEPAIYQLGERGLWSTITVHNYGSMEHLEKYWPIIQHVSLVNNEQFARKCLPIKNPDISFDENWSRLGKTPSDRCFEFDVDSCMYNTDLFVEQVSRLYDYLGFDDVKPELIKEYHTKYLELHQ